MTLTNDDLMAISQLFDVKMGFALEPVKDEIDDLKQNTVQLGGEIQGLKEHVQGLKGHVEKLPLMESEIQDLKEHVQDLKEHVEKLPSMEIEIQGLKEHVEKLSSMENEIHTLNQQLSGLKLHIENVTDKNIQLLAENYVPAARRYEEAVPKIEMMEADIDIMKKVIIEHSKKLKALA